MIVAKNLTMHYGATIALSDASFTAADKQVMGLLGPNGAGKTTSMNIITTQIVPTSGTATVDDFDIIKHPIEIRRILGYLPENAPVYNEMQVDEYLQFVAKGRQVHEAKIQGRLDWCVEATGIKGVYKRIIGELSRGYRQRVGLAQALVHDPDVLILDEPTAGLDPVQIIGIRKLIRDLSREKTIIFSTHILQEAQATSDKIVIISEGRIIADGTADELREKAGGGSMVRLTVDGNPDDIEKALRDIDGLRALRQDPTSISGAACFAIEADPGVDLVEKVSDKVQENNWKVREFTPHSLTLEETFISLIKESRRMAG
ncbi:MAG: ATP-binding cassette domain-containing protein [candidate division Zixibacteria bacterium]|nr:ATP-binding cassette domain-containing protein [candidate division Zixibacteria bacterium]